LKKKGEIRVIKKKWILKAKILNPNKYFILLKMEQNPMITYKRIKIDGKTQRCFMVMEVLT
jgi:hypothetical protein